MKTNSWLRFMAAMTLIAPTVASFAVDDLLGGGRGNGGGKGNSGGNGGGQSGGGKSNGGGNSGGQSGGGKSNGGGNSGGQTGGGKSNGGGNSGGSLGGGRGNSGGGSTTPVRDNPPNRDRDNGSSSQGGSRGNSNGGRDVIIVPDRGRPTQANEGRTGQSQYKGSNNGSNRGANNRDFVMVKDIPSYSEIRRQASREENVRISRGNTSYQYRSGYFHYDQSWTDRNFCYPHYSFQYTNYSALSPWYNYSYLPGYVSGARISFDNCWNLRVDLNFNYQWKSRSRYDRRSDTYELDEAVAAIDRAFDRDDPRIIGELIPRRDRVTIRSRWERPYTIGSDDFYDMMADLIENSRTRSYNIRSVQYDRGATTVRVNAEHVYTDAWRNQRSAWHSYTLEESRRGDYQIVEFASNDGAFDYNDEWRR